MFAELVKVLEQTGQLDNTYIVFTSDNGFHFGQHRLVEEGHFLQRGYCCPVHCAGTGVTENRTVAGFLAGNVDIPLTIADWAGVVPPDFVEGRSLAKVLAGDPAPETDCREAYLLEYYTPGDAGDGSASKSIVAPYKLGLRTTEYLYVEHSDGFVEFYDLITDPYELENIASTADSAQLEHFQNGLRLFPGAVGAVVSRWTWDCLSSLSKGTGADPV